MTFAFRYRATESPLVNTIWHTQSDGVVTETFTSQAENQWEMVITCEAGLTRMTVRGPETQARPAPIPRDAEFLGIVFTLGTYMPPIPTRYFVESEIDLPAASSRSFWLHGSAWQFPSFENADTFIERLLHDDLLRHDPVVMAALRGEAPDVSARTLQRQFIHATGLTQKAIAQIDRAKDAERLLQAGTPILDTAFQLGYYDQAHLTNALKRFIGQTPSQIVSQNA